MYTGYNAPLGKAGTRLGLLIDHPDLQPPPGMAHTSRVLRDGLTTLTFENQRRSVDAYARRRGLAVEHHGDLTRVTGPNVTAVLRFDHRNRMVAATTDKGNASGDPEALAKPS